MNHTARELDKKILWFIRQNSHSEKLFNSLTLEIFAYQYSRNSFYKKFCDLEGKNPGNIDSWKDIPALPTSFFKEIEIRCFPKDQIVRVFKTSGTTAEARGKHFFDTLKLYEAAILPPFKRYLLPDNPNLEYFYLIASPKEEKSSSLSYMIGVVNRRLAKNKGRFFVQKGILKTDALIQSLKASKRPVFILSTVFSLKLFLDELAKRDVRLRLKPGSRIMETGGFKGKVKEVSKKTLYRMITWYLNVPASFCVSEYGMTELSSQYYDSILLDRLIRRNRKPVKRGACSIRSLIIDPRTGKEVKEGQQGLLRHVDLANRGSIIAIQTEDLARKRKDGFELIGRAKQAERRGCSMVYETLKTSAEAVY